LQRALEKSLGSDEDNEEDYNYEDIEENPSNDSNLELDEDVRN